MTRSWIQRLDLLGNKDASTIQGHREIHCLLTMMIFFTFFSCLWIKYKRYVCDVCELAKYKCFSFHANVFAFIVIIEDLG